MRTTLSYLDPSVTGDHLITRNGAMFTITSQGPDGTKESLCTVPSCPNDSPAAIRAWYAVFSIHAANHGIFVQPYFCFRLEANAITGFTIGDDTDLVKFDVPGKFSNREQHWAMTIYTALSKSHVFPAGSTMQRAVTDNWEKGYDVLRAIIVPFHPLIIEQPSILVRDTPCQLPTESVSAYFYKYVDYLVLRAFIANIPHNLEVPGEMNEFLGGLTHCNVLRSDCRLDRKSTDPDRLRKYTQDQIVTTLTMLLHTHKLSDSAPPSSQACFGSSRTRAFFQAFPFWMPTTSFCELSPGSIPRWLIF